MLFHITIILRILTETPDSKKKKRKKIFLSFTVNLILTVPKRIL